MNIYSRLFACVVGTSLLALQGACAQTVNVSAAPVFSPDTTISLSVPTAPPTNTCLAVNQTASFRSQNIKQTFIDNFDKLDLNTSQWTPHYDGGYNEATKTWQGYDWWVKRTLEGNHEQQFYVDPLYKGTNKTPLGLNPFQITDGVLHIVGGRTPATLRQYLYNYEFISGVLTTRRSFVQQYGYFEMRAKVPAGVALVPAFWLISDDKSWPPEIDVMEAPGSEPDTIVTTAHWKDATSPHKRSGCRTVVPGFAKEFHLYGALWAKDRIVYYIDRKPVGQIATPAGMDRPMYMILNLSIGNDWAGSATPSTPLAPDYQVDWVSAYTIGALPECVVLSNGVKQCKGI